MSWAVRNDRSNYECTRSKLCTPRTTDTFHINGDKHNIDIPNIAQYDKKNITTEKAAHLKVTILPYRKRFANFYSVDSAQDRPAKINELEISLPGTVKRS